MPPNQKLDSFVEKEDAVTEKDRTILFLNGQWYDVTSWVPYHPGGPLIKNYHLQDATAIFEAMHSEETIGKLKTQFKPMLPDNPHLPNFTPETPQVMKDFAALRAKFEKEGRFETKAWWYFYKTFTTYCLLFTALYAISHSQFVLGGLFLGMFWQQMGWLTHEYAHHQVFKNRKWGNLFAILMGNFSQGFSSTWWKDRHNSHHASTNLHEVDPDLDNLPVLVWTKKDAPRLKDMPVTQKMIRYQAYYFMGVLSLLRVIWCLQSLLFIFSRLKTEENKYFVKQGKWEGRALIAHWLCVAAICLYCGSFRNAAVVMVISQLLAGFGIGIVVFFNHYAMHHFHADTKTNFFNMQLRTTRNLTPGIVTDWLCGGLNYQIEHHLFPTMPRHNLLAISGDIKAFCKKHNIKYDCMDFIPGVKEATKQLDKMSRHIADMYGPQAKKVQ
eukprot:TRINITY_DN546_c0_g1_i1.p1 TRINITY_DN546_c0_g1~~TRINITY_DN546_c0_g1_i1.p1  ORF type:complete len:441 (-),score=139.52 TRINITY_DN546_c0_g1_i1:1373-2695(-)